jgi:hypothetical protein
MLGRYTTGLQLEILGFFVISLTLNIPKEREQTFSYFLLFHGIFIVVSLTVGVQS